MIEVNERRRFRRYPIYCPIEYKCENEEPRGASITLNLSEGGALITTKHEISPDTRLIIKMVLRGEIFFVRAKVVHVQYARDEGLYNVGVEFTQSTFNFTRKFYEEMEAIMLYQRQCSRETGRPISIAEASMKWYGAPGVA